MSSRKPGTASLRRLLALAVAVGLFGGGVIAGSLVATPDRKAKLKAWARDKPLLRRLYRETADAAGRGRRAGRWNQAPEATPHVITGSETDRIQELTAVGYLAGYEPAGELSQVTVHVEEQVYPGANLVLSGHAPEATLIDMDGTVLHRWRLDFRRAFPNVPQPKRLETLEYWRRVHLFEDGDLLAIFPDGGLLRIDRRSQLLWAVPGRFHHDLWVAADGTIYALSRRAVIVPWIHESELVLEDFIVVLNAEGEVLREVSLLAALRNSDYASFLEKRRPHGNIFHTNTLEIVEPVEAAPEFFSPGLALVSMRNLDLIALVDLEQERVTWALSGLWHEQHQPTLLENGRLLLFDNLGHDGRSKAIEFDPATQEITWSYLGTVENGFLSETMGSVQRLPNGNTLVTESDSGRAFELNPDNLRVWEFYNPHRAGDADELIATLFEVVRYDNDYVAGFLARAGAGEDISRETVAAAAESGER